MYLNLYYALHFVLNYNYYAGNRDNIVDITGQIAPNKDLAKRRPGCQIKIIGFWLHCIL